MFAAVISKHEVELVRLLVWWRAPRKLGNCYNTSYILLLFVHLLLLYDYSSMRNSKYSMSCYYCLIIFWLQLLSDSHKFWKAIFLYSQWFSIVSILWFSMAFTGIHRSHRKGDGKSENGCFDHHKGLLCFATLCTLAAAGAVDITGWSWGWVMLMNLNGDHGRTGTNQQLWGSPLPSLWVHGDCENHGVSILQ